MEVKLKVCVGASSGQEVRVGVPKFFIGRAEDCHMRPKSDLISRHHCVIMVDENTVVVRDLGSRNGTLVNGERVVGEVELKSGDQLKVGPLEFEVHLTEAPAAKRRPKVTSIKEAAARTAEARTPDDADVSDWLEAEEKAAADPSLGITRPQNSTGSETEEIHLESTVIDNPPAAPEPESTPEPSVTRVVPPPSKAPGKPGKLPPIPRHTSTDSRDAAAEVLRKMFRRR